MEKAHVYLLLGLVLAALEIAVPGFVLLPLGIAAVLTALVAFVVPATWVHLLVFAGSALILFMALSRWGKLRLGQAKEPTQLGLVGQIGSLIEPVVSPEKPGKVKVYADVWEILWDDENPKQRELVALHVGARVRIVRVVGNRVFIEPVS